MSSSAIDLIMIGKLSAVVEGAYSDWRSDIPFCDCLERHPGFIKVQINLELRQTLKNRSYERVNTMILVEFALGLFVLALVVMGVVKLAEKLGIIETVKSWFRK